jgi:adenosylhomocysteine nucleosidase
VANQVGVPIRVIKHVSDSASEGAAKSLRATMAGSAHALAEWIESNVAAPREIDRLRGRDSVR